MKKRTLLWTLLMLLVVVVLLGSVIGANMYKQKAMNDYFANMPEPSFPVTVSQVKAQDWTPIIEAIGFIEPKQGVTLTTETSGVIKDIAFESGASVKKGQMLLALDSAVEKANLKSAQARLPAAQAKYERYRGLYAKGSLSKESFDEAEAAYFSLSADIESLKATIARREITAPFSGSVGIRNIYVGQYLNIGANIVRLEDTSVMRLHFTIPQTDLSKISIGQTVDISVDAYPDDSFKGAIKAIEPAVNAQSGLVQVEATIPNSDGKLRSGMFAKAHILLPVQKDQIIIPQVSIAYTLYGDSVYIVTEEDGEKRVQQHVIQVGERKNDVAHILSGVKDGDTLVTSGQVRLSNGAQVHVVESDALTPSSEVPML